MFNIGAGEFTVIVLVALLLFGPDRIPGIARTLAKGYRELNRLRKQMDASVKELKEDLKIDLDIDELAALDLQDSAPLVRAPQGERAARGNPQPAVSLEVPEVDDYLAGDGSGSSASDPPLLVALAEDDYLSASSSEARGG